MKRVCDWVDHVILFLLESVRIVVADEVLFVGVVALLLVVKLGILQVNLLVVGVKYLSCCIKRDSGEKIHFFIGTAFSWLHATKKPQFFFSEGGCARTRDSVNEALAGEMS